MKTAFTLLVLIFAVKTFAQTERKNWHLGGGINLSFDTNEYEVVPNGIHLQQGYFLKKNLLLGLHLSSNFYAISNITSAGVLSNDPQLPINYKRTYLNGTVAPFVRYFVGKSKWRPYVEGQAGVVYKSFKQLFNDPSINKITSNGYYGTASVGVGLSYFPYKSYGVDIGLSYQILDKFPDDTHWSSPVMLRIGLRNVLSKK